MTSLALVIVLLAALMTPLLMAKFKISYLPTAVAEILVGILLGQSGFHLISTTPTLTELSSLGVTVLIFLSGMEIDFELFKKQPATAKSGVKTPLTPLQLAVGSFYADPIKFARTRQFIGVEWVVHRYWTRNNSLFNHRVRGRHRRVERKRTPQPAAWPNNSVNCCPRGNRPADFVNNLCRSQ